MVDIRPISKEWIEFLNLKKTELYFSYNDNQTLSQTTTGIKLGWQWWEASALPTTLLDTFLNINFIIHCNNKPFGKKDHQHPRTYNVTVC